VFVIDRCVKMTRSQWYYSWLGYIIESVDKPRPCRTSIIITGNHMNTVSCF
jgi:hypothetical protein